ncbi:hypothetical protein VP01_7905g1 [Puccinia sorghi]|uniref:Uncharacterized protein n=1 Tax=Puccinia sorghi TaxID=27349 RepID=A0A0L6UAW1_9BASI|nr:hypothetical protein VP01_7905g1 [Puccinia sorghi]
MSKPRRPSCKKETPLELSHSTHLQKIKVRYSYSMEHVQDSHLETCKELYSDIQAQSNFYLFQGFFHKIEHTTRHNWVKYDNPCKIDHWMNMQTTGHILSQSFFPSPCVPNKNPPIFLALTFSCHLLSLKMEDENLFQPLYMRKNSSKLQAQGILK